MKQRFITRGHVRYAFAHNPLVIHSNARMLASAGLCAQRAGRFWEMHDALFDEQPKSSEDVRHTAERLGIGIEQFAECMESRSELDKVIDGNIEMARSLGLSGTPAFAIGTVDSMGRFAVRKLIVGAQPIEVFVEVLGGVSATVGTL